MIDDTSIALNAAGISYVYMLSIYIMRYIHVAKDTCQ